MRYIKIQQDDDTTVYINPAKVEKVYVDSNMKRIEVVTQYSNTVLDKSDLSSSEFNIAVNRLLKVVESI